MRPLVWCLTHPSLRSDCQFGTKAELVTRQQKNSRRKCMLVVQHLGAVETAAHLIDQFFSVCRCGTDRQGGPAHRGHRLHPPLWGDGNAQTAPDINAVLTGNSRSGGFLCFRRFDNAAAGQQLVNPRHHQQASGRVRVELRPINFALQL